MACRHEAMDENGTCRLGEFERNGLDCTPDCPDYWFDELCADCMRHASAECLECGTGICEQCADYDGLCDACRDGN